MLVNAKFTSSKANDAVIKKFERGAAGTAAKSAKKKKQKQDLEKQKAEEAMAAAIGRFDGTAESSDDDDIGPTFMKGSDKIVDGRAIKLEEKNEKYRMGHRPQEQRPPHNNHSHAHSSNYKAEAPPFSKSQQRGLLGAAPLPEEIATPEIAPAAVPVPPPVMPTIPPPASVPLPIAAPPPPPMSNASVTQPVSAPPASVIPMAPTVVAAAGVPPPVGMPPAPAVPLPLPSLQPGYFPPPGSDYPHSGFGMFPNPFPFGYPPEGFPPAGFPGYPMMPPSGSGFPPLPGYPPPGTGQLPFPYPPMPGYPPMAIPGVPPPAPPPVAKDSNPESIPYNFPADASKGTSSWSTTTAGGNPLAADDFSASSNSAPGTPHKDPTRSEGESNLKSHSRSRSPTPEDDDVDDDEKWFALNAPSDPIIIGNTPSESCTIFIKDLADWTTVEQVASISVKYGPLGGISISKTRSSTPVNYSVVTFMSHGDAEAAVIELDGRELDGNKLTVVMSPEPYRVPEYPTYIDFETTSLEDAKSRFPILKTVEVDPSMATHTRNLIDLAAASVVKYGGDFEEALSTREASNPAFAFLRPPYTSPEQIYYIWRVYSLSQGDSMNSWRTTPFQMYLGDCSVWVPPSQFQSDIETDISLKVPQSSGTTPLEESQKNEFFTILRELKGTRDSISNAMMFCIENSISSQQISDILADALTLRETPWQMKLCRVHLVSDILHNSSSRAPNARLYRKYVEGILPRVFISLRETLQITDELRQPINNVLQVWKKYVF